MNETKETTHYMKTVSAGDCGVTVSHDDFQSGSVIVRNEKPYRYESLYFRDFAEAETFLKNALEILQNFDVPDSVKQPKPQEPKVSLGKKKGWFS